jgi:hypothetical protein
MHGEGGGGGTTPAGVASANADPFLNKKIPSLHPDLEDCVNRCDPALNGCDPSPSPGSCPYGLFLVQYSCAKGPAGDVGEGRGRN